MNFQTDDTAVYSDVIFPNSFQVSKIMQKLQT